MAAAQGAAGEVVSAGLYGPQPNQVAIDESAPVYEPVAPPVEMIPRRP